MKKALIFLFSIIVLAVAGFSPGPSADSLQPIPFPFIGKWNPSEDPALLDDYGLQDVQNVRKMGKRFKGIGGHTVVNSTSLSAYPYLLNGFHFYKDQPQESHVIILAASTTTSPGASYLFENTAAVPGTGNFSAATLHTDASGGAAAGRFTLAPAGNMIYANGVETLIWGGNEIEPVSFIAATTALTGSGNLLTNPKDYSDAVRDTKATTDSVANIDAAYPVWVMGFYRPLQGAKFYISTANTSTATLSADEWTGTAWSALTITDNTSSGGKSLAQTGTVTWASTENTSKLKYLNGMSLYWYQFKLSAGAAAIYYATVDGPPQAIKNIWDGDEVFPAKFVVWSGASSMGFDYSGDVIDESTLTYAVLDSLSSGADYVLVGFSGPQQGLSVTIHSANSVAASALTVSYWTGGAFAACSGLYDGTSAGTTSLSKTGIISWQPNDPGTEFKTAIADELPLYYYKLAWGATLDSTTKISEVRGIPFPQPISTYAFGETFQNRLFLFNDSKGDKNKAVYSMDNAPDIFNGLDSGVLFFGDKTEITAAKAIFNVFRNFSADQLIVAKKNETWRVSGDNPTNWIKTRMSSNVGCVAPLSMVACEVSDGSEADVKRQVAIWQSDKGFVMSDGAAIMPISDEIRCYFDPNDSRYIPAARQAKTVAWFDPFTRSYKALISSGSGATYHNVELEYSLTSKEWTKIYREDASGADPLQCGFQVFDTSGIGYTYGGSKKGFVYRLENGATFNGTNITNKIQTKDMILDTQMPLFRKSTVKFLRTAYKSKAGSVSVAHYGDRVLTVSGSSNQMVPAAFSTSSGFYNTQSCGLGPFLYHSFLFTSVSSAADGMELNGLAIYAEPYTAMR